MLQTVLPVRQRERDRAGRAYTKGWGKVLVHFASGLLLYIVI